MVVKVQTNELETLLECCCLMKMTLQTGRTVWEAQLTEVLEDHDRQEILMDQQAQPDTDRLNQSQTCMVTRLVSCLIQRK